MNKESRKALEYLAIAAVVFAASVIPAFSQTEAQPSQARASHSGSSAEVLALKQQLAAQQKQIEQMQAALAEMEKRLDQADRRSATAQSTAAAAPAETAQASPAAKSGSSRAPGEPASLGQVASLSPAIPSTTVGATLVSLEAPPRGPGSSAPQGMEQKLSDLAYGKIKLGATFFGDYAFYTATGFGPQFLTQTNQPGPGNAGFNSFDVTRTYINFFYTPNEAVTLRFTPNIYRQVDVSGATGNGKGAAIGSSSNGNLAFRLKYAYVDFNTLFKNTESFKKDKVTLGQTTNPLIDWEEGLWGYRYVSLVPWNYLSLSSTYVGATLHGPIEWNGKEYLDYHLGVFNTASFHSIEQNDKKQVMARATWYPTGTTSDRTGFGATAFMDYGYNTKTPDTRSTPLYRFSALAHYQTHSKGYMIAGEYDMGRNAFSTGNLFSGVGPADEFGLGPTPFATFDALAKALLGGDHTRQRGFDFFGHARIAKSPFAVFGMFQYFQPNTNVSNDPLDFRRIVAGISYKYNKHFEIAFDNQNLTYTKGQFTFPSSALAMFSSSLAAANPNGIPNAVPQNTNGLFINLLFNY